MQNQVFHYKRLPCVFLALMTLLLPATTQAQSITITPPTNAARDQRYQEVMQEFAAQQQRYRETHKSVILTVDYVDIALTDLLKASQWVASGEQHDALLLAALVKAGAQDTKGTQIQAWDKQTLGRGTQVPLAAGNGQAQTQKIYSRTEATPQFNADGTIKILIRLALGERRDPSLPPSGSDYQCAVPTFHDGDTVKIAESVTHSAVGTSTAHLTFVRVTIPTDNSVSLEPIFQIPPAPAVPIDKPSSAVPTNKGAGDPGILLDPGNSDTQDQNMVLGRGTHPEQTDSMNLFPLPALPK